LIHREKVTATNIQVYKVYKYNFKKRNYTLAQILRFKLKISNGYLQLHLQLAKI